MTDVGGIAADQLAQTISGTGRLEEEKANLMADIKEVYGEAKALGYDVKILRQIIRLRKMEDHEREEQAEILEVYKRPLGMSGGPSRLDRAKAKGEAFKEEMLDHPEVRRWIDSLWIEAKRGMISAANDPSSELRVRLVASLQQRLKRRNATHSNGEQLK